MINLIMYYAKSHSDYPCAELYNVDNLKCVLCINILILFNVVCTCTLVFIPLMRGWLNQDQDSSHCLQ